MLYQLMFIVIAQNTSIDPPQSVCRQTVIKLESIKPYTVYAW